MKVGGFDLPVNFVLVIVVAIILMALGAVLFIPQTDEGTRRLGLFFGLVSNALLVSYGMLKSQQTATHTEQLTNGFMDNKIKTATSQVVQEQVLPAIEAASANVIADAGINAGAATQQRSDLANGKLSTDV